MKARARKEKVRAELPDALDLLAVSVEAGLSFDGAISKLTEHMHGPLARSSRSRSARCASARAGRKP